MHEAIIVKRQGRANEKIEKSLREFVRIFVLVDSDIKTRRRIGTDSRIVFDDKWITS